MHLTANRTSSVNLSVELWDTTRTSKLTEVKVDEPVYLVIKVINGELSSPISPLDITLTSGYDLLKYPGDSIYTISSLIDSVISRVVFTNAPSGELDQIRVTGVYNNSDIIETITANSGSIHVLPSGGTSSIVNVLHSPAKVRNEVELLDLAGRNIHFASNVNTSNRLAISNALQMHSIPRGMYISTS